MMIKLGEITQIHTGIYAKPAVGPDTYYLQARHFDENGFLIAMVEPELRLNDREEKHLLQKGDILLAVKGTKNIASVYSGYPERAVASSSFLVIRIEEENIIKPEYLAWFINQPHSQQYLKMNAKGTSLPSVSIKIVEELEVNIPPLKIQEDILHIYKLRMKELSLRKKLEELRTLEIQKKLMDLTLQ